MMGNQEGKGDLHQQLKEQNNYKVIPEGYKQHATDGWMQIPITFFSFSLSLLTWKRESLHHGRRAKSGFSSDSRAVVQSELEVKRDALNV